MKISRALRAGLLRVWETPQIEEIKKASGDMAIEEVTTSSSCSSLSDQLVAFYANSGINNTFILQSTSTNSLVYLYRYLPSLISSQFLVQKSFNHRFLIQEPSPNKSPISHTNNGRTRRSRGPRARSPPTRPYRR